MADSGIAIPAISHENFLPAMGSEFPETADAFWPPVSAFLHGVDGAGGSNRRSAERPGTPIAETIQTSGVSRRDRTKAAERSASEPLR